MSRYLLDTHVFLWLVEGGRSIPGATRDAIEDGNSDLYLSIASIAELCIKSGLGKLRLPDVVEAQPASGFKRILEANAIDALPVSIVHAAALRDLPLHHRDPFDRLLIAQAIAEDLTLVTHDRAFAQYEGLSVLWA